MSKGRVPPRLRIAVASAQLAGCSTLFGADFDHPLENSSGGAPNGGRSWDLAGHGGNAWSAPDLAGRGGAGGTELGGNSGTAPGSGGSVGASGGDFLVGSGASVAGSGGVSLAGSGGVSLVGSHGEGGAFAASGAGGALAGSSGEGGSSAGTDDGGSLAGSSGDGGASGDEPTAVGFDSRVQVELVGEEPPPVLVNPVTFCVKEPPADLDLETVRRSLRDAAFVWQRDSSLRLQEVSCAETSQPNLVFSWRARAGGAPGSPGTLDELVELSMRDSAPTSWSIVFGELPFTTAMRGDAGAPFDLVTVAAHAIGHALGFGHSRLSDALMTAVYRGSHRGLRPEETSAVQALYPPSCRGPAIHARIGYKLEAQHSGKIADAAGADATIVQSTDTGSASQLFRFEAIGDGHFKIVSKASEMLWTIADRSMAPGAPISLYPNLGGDYQEWCVVNTFMDTLALVARHDGQPAGVRDASFDDGAPLEQKPFSGSPEQAFRLVVGDCDGAALDTSLAYRIVAKHSGKLASVGLPFEPLVQAPGVAGSSPLWHFVALDRGFHSIISTTGFAWNVTWFSTALGARVAAGQNWGTVNEHWCVLPVGDGTYQIVSRQTGFSAEVDGASTETNAEIVMGTPTNGDHQVWRLVPE